MSWQKCDNAEPYSLAVPAVLIGALGAVHVWLGLSVLALALPSEAVALLWLFLLRSWQTVQIDARTADSLVLSMDRRNRFLINEVPRSKSGAGRHKREGGSSCYPRKCGTRSVGRNLLYGGGSGAQNSGQAQEHRYTCFRSVKMPGCLYIELQDDYGKHLEILVFYRYYQRQFYRRLLSQLAFL